MKFYAILAICLVLVVLVSGCTQPAKKDQNLDDSKDNELEKPRPLPSDNLKEPITDGELGNINEEFESLDDFFGTEESFEELEIDEEILK